MNNVNGKPVTGSLALVKTRYSRPSVYPLRQRGAFDQIDRLAAQRFLEDQLVFALNAVFPDWFGIVAQEVVPVDVDQVESLLLIERNLTNAGVTRGNQ